jgi:hypothetical protein
MRLLPCESIDVRNQIEAVLHDPFRGG